MLWLLCQFHLVIVHHFKEGISESPLCSYKFLSIFCAVIVILFVIRKRYRKDSLAKIKHSGEIHEQLVTYDEEGGGEMDTNGSVRSTYTPPIIKVSLLTVFCNTFPELTSLTTVDRFDAHWTLDSNTSQHWRSLLFTQNLILQIHFKNIPKSEVMQSWPNNDPKEKELCVCEILETLPKTTKDYKHTTRE